MKSILRSLVLAAAALILTNGAPAQQQFNVLDWKAEYSLNVYLVQRMHQQYKERRLALREALRSESAATKYVQQCQNNARIVFGPMPAKTPLNPVIVSTMEGEGYSIQKIVYESFPRHHVTTNFYRPAGRGPFPAALFLCGHEDAAKATESYQKTAILFAENGFAVLVVDPISQGERRQLTDASGTPVVRGGTTEHTLLNAGSNLLGTSTAAYELWDNIRGVDYLESRPEVDGTRIGCLGNSGGGMQTVYMLSFERRLKVAAVCSFLASRERNFDLTIVSDGCSQMPDEGKMRLEMADFAIAAAPAPILILAGRYDFIDYTGTLDAYNDMKGVYQTLNAPDKVSLFTYDDGHGFSRPKREAAVTWFRKWLCGDSTRIVESAVRTLSEKDLACTTSGQVNSQYADEATVEARNEGLFSDLRKKRDAFKNLNHETQLKRVADLLSISPRTPDIRADKIGEIRVAGAVWQKIIVRKPDEIPLPLLESRPGGIPKKVVVWFPAAGKNKMVDSVSLMEQYSQEGAVVLLCDIRGMGETTDKAEFNDPKYYNGEYRNAILALHIGRPLVGQRVNDILTVLDYLASDDQLKHIPIELNASGPASLPAIHALLFDTLVTHLNVYNAPRTYETIVRNPVDTNSYSHVIPAILRCYDIPDLVNMAGARRITWAN